MPTARIRFPRLHQGQQGIHNALGPRNVLRCGRRFGKTVLLETTFGYRAIQGRKIGWFTPDYKLARPTFSRMRKLLTPAVRHASKVDSVIELETGGLIEFWTLDNEDAGRSRDYDDAVIDEASLVKKGLKDIVEQSIMPTLLDRRGTITLAGTPKGIDPENFLYMACTDEAGKFSEANPRGWREFYAPTRDNPLLDWSGVENLINEYPALVYQQEYLAEFVDWSGVAFFPQGKLLYDGSPVEYPAGCDAVFAVIDTATKTGKENDGTAVIYFAFTSSPWTGPPLVILDWDIQQIEGALLEAWIPGVFSRLQVLAGECRARRGSVGAFIEDKASGMVLIQQCARRNLPGHAIDSKLTSVGKVERAISISGYIHRGMVKFSRVAFEKVSSYKGIVRNHCLSQVVGFRVDIKDQVDDDLLDDFCYGTAIALGDSGGF